MPTTIEIVDIAGLVKGAHKGEGLGNQFLGNIREVDAIIHVLRCFDDDNIVHVEGSVNPVRDKEIIDLELQLKDLETDKKITYRLVGQDEADIKKNLVFFKSPIGKALIGKNKKEMITVTTPSGERNFEVLGVEYI